MFELSARLRENPLLRALVSHYAQLGAADRAAWQDRVMHLDGAAALDLTALHGELIAFDGIEPNTGGAVPGPAGAVRGCYRVTRDGLREYRRLHGLEAVEEPPEAPENARARPPRKRKDRAGSAPQPPPHPDEPRDGGHDSATEVLPTPADRAGEDENRLSPDPDVVVSAPDAPHAPGGEQRE